jgi:hypothetical protein
MRSSAPTARSQRNRSLATQNPHENKLDDVRVDEQELGAAVSLRAGDGVHRSGAQRRIACRVREQDVFQGPELWSVSSVIQDMHASHIHTRKKALARNVYVNTTQPTQLLVPLPGVRTSDEASVTMIPTNL